MTVWVTNPIETEEYLYLFLKETGNTHSCTQRHTQTHTHTHTHTCVLINYTYVYTHMYIPVFLFFEALFSHLGKKINFKAVSGCVFPLIFFWGVEIMHSLCIISPEGKIISCYFSRNKIQAFPCAELRRMLALKRKKVLLYKNLFAYRDSHVHNFGGGSPQRSATRDRRMAKSTGTCALFIRMCSL